MQRKFNEYNSMKISKIKSIRNSQKQPVGIKIYGDNVCRNGSNECVHNGSSECWKCSIMSGDTKLPIRFYPAEKIETIDELDQRIKTPIIKPVENLELLKPPLPEIESPKQIIDANDLPHFTKFGTEKLNHLHSGCEKFHTHYFVNVLWTRCYICSTKIVGATSCNNCEVLFK